MSDILKKLLITGLGTGYLRPAPGTWGSLGPCIIFFFVALACTGSVFATSAAMLAIVIVSSVICVALGDFAEKTFGRKDPSQVTIDEWAGQAMTLFLMPTCRIFREGGFGGYGSGGCFVTGYNWQDTLLTVGGAFIAFRLFDITKPPPARQFEKLPKGWGVLLDDLMAGVYANIVCQLILRSGFGLK